MFKKGVGDGKENAGWSLEVLAPMMADAGLMNETGDSPQTVVLAMCSKSLDAWCSNECEELDRRNHYDTLCPRGSLFSSSFFLCLKR